MEIGNWSSDSDEVYFIAEAGVNHNGQVGRAERLVDAASAAGADAVKFQTFDADELVIATAEPAAYQRDAVDVERQRDLLCGLELSRDDHEQLRSYCADVGIEFLSTPFGIETATFLDSLAVRAFKIGSGDLTNHPLLRRVSSFGRPMIVSTGMATLDEVRDAYEVITNSNPDISLALLHCVSAYPTPLVDANLRAIRTLSESFPVPVGYSDHTRALETPGLAIAAGAQIIEKHLTLDRDLAGPDHQASLEPDELQRAVTLARDAAIAMGDGKKRPRESERDAAQTARKGLYAARDIAKGQQIDADDVAIRRPPTELEASAFDDVVGRVSTQDVVAGEPIPRTAIGGP